MVKLILAIDNCGFQSNLAFEFQQATREDRLSKENNNFEILRLSYINFLGRFGDIMEAGDDSEVEEVSVVVEEVGEVSTSKDTKQEESFHGFEDKVAIFAALKRLGLQTEIKKLEQWIKEVEEDKSDE